jgi:hypothetical protein
VAKSTPDGQWVLLAYRLPRVPSTPRSTIWRKLKRLGVAQITDGLVALPADARTREALDWIADEVLEYGGEAMVWLGQPADTRSRASVRDRMSAAVAAEYLAVTAEVAAAVAAEYLAVTAEVAAARNADPAVRRRIAARLRRELQRIDARDFFRPAVRDTARQAVDDILTTSATSTRTTRARS